MGNSARGSTDRPSLKVTRVDRFRLVPSNLESLDEHRLESLLVLASRRARCVLVVVVLSQNAVVSRRGLVTSRSYFVSWSSKSRQENKLAPFGRCCWSSSQASRINPTTLGARQPEKMTTTATSNIISVSLLQATRVKRVARRVGVIKRKSGSRLPEAQQSDRALQQTLKPVFCPLFVGIDIESRWETCARLKACCGAFTYIIRRLQEPSSCY